MKLLLFLLIINLKIKNIVSYKNINKQKNKKLFAINIIQPNFLKYKEIFQEENFNNLVKDIDNNQIENIYLSNDFKKIYAKHKNLGDKEQIIDYTSTLSDSTNSNILIEHTNNKKVNTMILAPSVDPVIKVVSQIFDVANFLFFPTLLLIMLFNIFVRNSFGGVSNPLNSNNQMSTLNPFGNMKKGQDKLNMIKSNITLDSWAGSPEIFEECTEVVSYLRNNTLYKLAGAEIPKGILLEGPPGTGKTLIAKAIASEADANFISISASEFVELFVGMGAAKVRNLFRQARENAPSIIFIDEIDAVGKQRGTGLNMGNDEREQTLNQLLAEMDGFSINENVLVIAATNRKDVLDSALLRPGRFDRIINVPLPDKQSRKSILNVHLKNKKIENNISLDFLAELSAGFSGAQLKNLVNEAAINSVKMNNTIITQKNLEDALEKLLVGIIKKTDTRSDEAIKRVAIHEIGHAFLASYFKDYFELKKVTIQSTYNGAGGYTIFSEYAEIIESGLYTKDILLKRIIVALGGKAAENIFYGENHVSIGAIQDLKQANSIAQQMVGNYGMGRKLEVFYNENTEAGRNPFLGRSLAMGDKYSEKTKEIFDEEVLDIINEAYKESLNIIRINKYKIELLVNILINNTVLDGHFVNNFIISND